MHRHRPPLHPDSEVLHACRTRGTARVVLLAGERRSGVIAAVREVVDAGFVTVLDLVFLSRSSTGEIREIDVSEKLDDVGLGHLEIQEQALISEDDLDLARDILEPGHSAAVIVYENSWARTVSGAIAEAGGELTLHVRIPRDVVEAALEAAEMD